MWSMYIVCCMRVHERTQVRQNSWKKEKNKNGQNENETVDLINSCREHSNVVT